MKILVTGSAGFIGYHVALQLLQRGDDVIGVDNLNDYYDVSLKNARLEQLQSHMHYRHSKLNIADKSELDEVLQRERPDRVVHLAAQAGVRHSIDHPYDYVDSNLTGFLNLLEGLRVVGSEHLVFASTSSVYGGNTAMPFSVRDNVDHPLNLYAATKKANELMAHSYAHLFAIPCTGLRFFTVYGPWGRPDMAFFKFTRQILADEPIDVYNYGHHKRDFTYIDDIVEGIVRVLDRPARPDPEWSSDSPKPQSSNAPYRLYNIGSNHPVDLLRYIEVLEETLGRHAKKNMLPMQPGDVPDTYADVDDLIADFDYQPQTSVETGLRNFVSWYKDYYGITDVAHNV